MLTIDGIEREMGADDLIVSKTNLKGHLTYANDTFLKIADFTLKEVLGKPHSVVRNDAMPRCIFKLLWETIQGGREIFAYVVNRTRDGDHYWVLAHVTPNFDEEGNVTGYHSNRRKPAKAAVEAIRVLYGVLLAEEARLPTRKEGLAAASAMLGAILSEKGISYDEYVLSL